MKGRGDDASSQVLCVLPTWLKFDQTDQCHQNPQSRPGWFGSVDRALACRLKGPRFHSNQGPMPGLQARSPEWSVQEAAYQCFSLIMDVSISLSSPFLSEINICLFFKPSESV
ncbi:unnamed protein product [Pipistrellus nathusii]|uniref:Uncharacterized protein n=1 Tax=Pipistrellus nathusii TaxID=59473 RepID=A0ABP0AM63_PIPNA